MSYVFDIETLYAIARQGVGKAHDEMVGIVVEEAARAYPAHIDPSPRRRWLFSHEDMPFYPFDRHLPYGFTKHLTEHECLKAHANGLNVVVATSCAILGPHDYVPSRMGRVLIDYAHGSLRAYIPGGFEFVSSRDIAEGRPLPRLRLPPLLMAALAEVADKTWFRAFPNLPRRFTPGAVRLLQMRRRADHNKAKQELGYQPTQLSQSVQKAYEDFVRRGLIVTAK